MPLSRCSEWTVMVREVVREESPQERLEEAVHVEEEAGETRPGLPAQRDSPPASARMRISEMAGSYALVVRSISPSSRRKTCRSSRIGETDSASRSASRPALTRRLRSTSNDAASLRPARRTRLIRRSSSRRWWMHGRLASARVP